MKLIIDIVTNYLEVGTTSQQFTQKQLFPINKITTECVARIKEHLKLQFYVEENWDNKPLFKKEGRPNFEKDYNSKWLIIDIKETIWAFTLQVIVCSKIS